MKLVWSPETASKAYIDTVKSCQLYQESGVAELVSAMAAGWNAKFIVEAWSQGGVIATSVGLEVASRHTEGRHVCIVPDERSRSEYIQAMTETAGISPEVVVGEAEQVMEGITGIDFLVVDCARRDFSRVLRLAKLSNRGAVLVCKNANLIKSGAGFRWRSIIDDDDDDDMVGSRRLVRSVYLPVGKGLDIAHVATGGPNPSSRNGERRWIKHVDQRSGEEHVIRK
ncbi:uncharacterized protein LOC110817529 [Carica papaya]|uniref:uncharacterized protein LOC110817529 n=1 Tax=Carica papaya TaxID=3649 RepID=UPI000B8CA5B8|nr:uncharacterized protein LOC110817529 [Carica papaya]